MQISFFDNISTWSKNSSLLKLMVIGILFLLLLIPQSMVSSLIQEREHIRDEAIKEVSSKWGLEQMITPPVLNIPYRYTFKDEKGLLSEQIGYAHFLPESNHTKGALTPEKRYRGIYMVVLYNAVLKITGNFAYPNFDELDIPISDYLMDEAFISFGISDLKGLKRSEERRVGKECCR